MEKQIKSLESKQKELRSVISHPRTMRLYPEQLMTLSEVVTAIKLAVSQSKTLRVSQMVELKSTVASTLTSGELKDLGVWTYPVKRMGMHMKLMGNYKDIHMLLETIDKMPVMIDWDYFHYIVSPYPIGKLDLKFYVYRKPNY